MVNITSGFESLQAYQDMSDDDSDSATEKSMSDSGDAATPSLRDTLMTLFNLQHSVVKLSQDNLIPFNATHLINLLNEIRSVSFHYYMSR